MRRILQGFSLLLTLGIVVPQLVPVLAADVTAGGVATSVVISDKNIQDGAIVSYINNKYILSNTPYDASIFGVVSKNPAIGVQDTTQENSTYVVTSGMTYVRVSTKGGTIKAGDLITTSTDKGVGMKANDVGTVLGAANESFSGPGVGEILVELHPAYANRADDVRQNLFHTIKLGITAPSLTPINAMRYLLAGGIVLISFVIGFVFFGRASSRGVEAIGRNPLARRIITLTVVLNVFLTLVIVVAGVAIAYMILVL